MRRRWGDQKSVAEDASCLRWRSVAGGRDGNLAPGWGGSTWGQVAAATRADGKSLAQPDPRHPAIWVREAMGGEHGRKSGNYFSELS